MYFLFGNRDFQKQQDISNTAAKAVKTSTRGPQDPREEQKVAFNQSKYQPKNNGNNFTTGTKLKQCNYFFQKGSCRFGSRCIYSHTLSETT
jgi:hypothetical protein